ncbi:MAG TPA: sulfatase [Gammaproteobacteria bacterium]
MRLLVALLAVAGLILCVSSQALAQFANRPNVLFISIDDLNDWVGPLDGHPQARTPNIDRLAAQGMVFTNAHAPGVICNTSRTAIMTGISPASAGVYGNQTDWRRTQALRDATTIPRLFKDSGYRTFGAGKLFHSSTFNPWAYFGYNDTTAWHAYFPSLDRQIPDEIRPHDRPLNGSPLSVNFDWGTVSATDEAMGDGQVVTWSVDQILFDDDSPRFNAVGIYRPHLPWYLPQKYFDLYPLDEIELPPVVENDLEDVPDAATRGADRGAMGPMALHNWVLEDETQQRWREGVRAYLASTTFADAQLGRILDALEESGRYDDTIIVLWSDHGFHLGERARWRKTTLWRESTRVPLIIVAPGITRPGTRTDSVVSLLDLYPTIVALAGLAMPSHPEGVSLVPLLEDPEAKWNHAAVTTVDFGSHSVSTDRYRYLRYADGSEELYDIDADPHEWRNLAADSSYTRVKAELAEWLPAHDEPVDPTANRVE